MGRYAVVRALAKGGMAELYLGRARGIEGFEKLVVLKCIRREYEHEGDFVRMFLDEARLAAMLSHPNIAQVFDVDRSNGRYFFAMEYVHGRDVRAIRQAAVSADGRLALEHALAIGVGVAAALHYAHELRDTEGRPRGIVHRDVSPSNVLVSVDGAVKLVDFGIARAEGRLAHTRTGTVKGKVRYMSPEQCLGHELDRRSDIYSLGALLYELTLNHPPFQADAEIALAHRIAHEDAPPPSARVADYPRDLEAIVMRALSRDRDERYATAQALQLDLEKLAVERGISLSPVGLADLMKRLFGPDEAVVPEARTISGLGSRPTRSANTRRDRSGRLRWLLAGSLATLAIAAAGYGALSGASNPQPVPPAATSTTTVPPPPPPPLHAEVPVAAPTPAPIAAPPRPAPKPESSTASTSRRHSPPRKPARTPPRRQDLPVGDDAPLP